MLNVRIVHAVDVIKVINDICYVMGNYGLSYDYVWCNVQT